MDPKPIFEQARINPAADSTTAVSMIDNDRYVRKYRSCYWNANVEQPQPQLNVELKMSGAEGSNRKACSIISLGMPGKGVSMTFVPISFSNGFPKKLQYPELTNIRFPSASHKAIRSG